MKSKLSLLIILIIVGLSLTSFIDRGPAGLFSIIKHYLAVTTSITSPSTGSWHSDNFDVVFSDAATDESNLLAEWRVISNGIITLSWTARNVDGTHSLSVGPSGMARHQGQNTVTVYSRLTDQNSGTSASSSRTFSIDWSQDYIQSLTAKTSSFGNTISQGSWTTDRDPYFEFSISTATKYSPISGYSWAFNTNPDDTPDLGGGDSGSLQLSFDYLTEGQHSFKIKAIDAAGNAGSIASYSFGVDYTPDNIQSLVAYTEDGGTVIPEDVWQTDAEVFFDWNSSASTSPIVGYSWALNSTPDFTADVISPGVTVTIPDGDNTFNVRAIDQAGNYGPLSSYNIRKTDVIYTLSYLSDGNGTINGENTQVVRAGDDGSEVEAVPAGGYEFVQWSDGSTDNPRTDLNVTEDITVTASFALLTGVTEIPEQIISCYPNPCSDFLILRLNNQNLNKNFSYQIIDMNGRLVRQGLLESTETTIDTRELDKAIYIIRILDSGDQLQTLHISKI